MKTVRWVYVVIMLALFPITTAAQTSLYGLPSGKIGGGFGIWKIQEQDSEILVGNLGFGFDEGNSKISLLAGRLLDDSYPTIYVGGIEGVHRYPIGLTDFDFFTVGEFLPLFVEDAVVFPTLVTGSLGLSKHIEIENGGLKPFVALSYWYDFIISGSETVGVSSFFVGVVGLECKISRWSIIGTASRPISSVGGKEFLFKVGVNILHPTQPSRRIYSTQEPSRRRSTPIPNEQGRRISTPIPPDESAPPTEPDQLTVEQDKEISAPIPLDELPPSGRMVLIPAGEFQMGSDAPEADKDEQPVHTVSIDAFYMDQYEVTNAQYKKFIDATPAWQKYRINSAFHHGNYLKDWNGDDYPKGKADHPVVSVSWYAAMAYAQWVGKRLPTEAEWEYAARSGWVGRKYLWGDVIDSSKANYGRNVGDTTPVGKYPPYGYGLYDMAGNVWEWCLDKYNADFYSVSPRKNPLASASMGWTLRNFTTVQTNRVLRGGSWGTESGSVRVAYRNQLNPASAYLDCGFRCVMSQ